MNGKNMAEFIDIKGKLYFLEYVDVAQKQGEGYVDIFWARASGDKPVPKLSFVKLYKPWNWVVGSSIYIDDVQTEMNKIREKVLYSILFLAIMNLLLVFCLNYGSDCPSTAQTDITSEGRIL
jgi:methyl-accepting chemotaxis protein